MIEFADNSKKEWDYILLSASIIELKPVLNKQVLRTAVRSEGIVCMDAEHSGRAEGPHARVFGFYEYSTVQTYTTTTMWCYNYGIQTMWCYNYGIQTRLLSRFFTWKKGARETYMET